MEPWHLALAFVGFAVTVVATLIGVGRFVGRIEVAAKRIERIEDRLERIPAIEQHLEMQDARLERIERRTDSAHAHAMRAEFVSEHQE